MGNTKYDIIQEQVVIEATKELTYLPTPLLVNSYSLNTCLNCDVLNVHVSLLDSE